MPAPRKMTMQATSKLDVPSTGPGDARRRKLLNTLLMGAAIASALLLDLHFRSF